ncbi:MAG TPA: DUF4440 domain-containing protein, partial [Candidatus Deferrimicrobium sp.]|nr:DUF4440 domain-containing protein [Candidatus Deferrimicrobium sp.]
MTEKSILLPKTGHPVQGKETCAQLITRLEMDGRESGFKWEPLVAGISAAGDLAYTHGRYELPTAVNKGVDKTGAVSKQEINYGYYATIWKKEADGNWKVAFSQGLVLLKGLNQKPLEEQLDPVKVDGVTREVLATERAFSDYSSANGQPAAFYHYIDDNGIALGAAGAPKTKADFARAVEKAAKQNQPRAGKLEWEPLYSYVASSGDMAYNFGTYVYTLNSEGNAQAGRGYFLTVWKKEPGKGWKFVLDCGNKVE